MYVDGGQLEGRAAKGCHGRKELLGYRSGRASFEGPPRASAIVIAWNIALDAIYARRVRSARKRVLRVISGRLPGSATVPVPGR